MQHKIKASLLEKSWFEPAIFDALDKFENGGDIYDSSLAVFLRSYKVWGGLHQSMIGKDIEVAIKDRIDNFIKLYLDIKKNGYNDSSPFFVWFDNDGFIHTYDGHHRLSIIRYLGGKSFGISVDPLVSISTEWTSKGIDPTGVEGRDFPIKELASSIWNKNRLYHYVDDPLNRFAGWERQRPDDVTRRDYILKNLTGKTVVDIGCSEGYLSREIARKDYDVTGIEKGYLINQEGRGRILIAITRYLATLQSIKIKTILSDWKDILRKDVSYDNILYLSVLHNEINALGYDVAMNNLKIFRGKCKRLFIEIPDIKVQKDWTYAFTIDDFVAKAQRLTGMELKEVWEGYRPIILLENKLK